MALYEFHLRRNGYAGNRVYHELADDLEALKTAEALSSNFDVEVASGFRFVAHIKRGTFADIRQRVSA
jgi:hypothetical protein